MSDETVCLKQKSDYADGGQEPADGAGDAPVAASGGELFAAAFIHGRHHEVAEQSDYSKNNYRWHNCIFI